MPLCGEHGVDIEGNGFDQGFEEVCSCPAIGFLMQFGVGELGCAVATNS
jgi:hypothetical protein